MQAFITEGRAEKAQFTGRQLAGLIWPMLVEQLLSVFVGMVDVLMVAAVGEAAVSGVALVDSVNVLILQVLFAICAGGSVICARRIGGGDGPGAGRVTGQLLLLTVPSTAVISMALLLGGQGLLRLLFGQAEAGIMACADTYLRIICLSIPFLAVQSTAAAALRAAGNTRVSMRWSLIMNLLNIAGNALCILGLHMGVEGVAIPTLLSRMVGALGLLWTMQRIGCPARLRSAGDLRPEGRAIREILSIGIPNALESGIFQFGKLSLQSLVATLGSASIAGFAVASNLVTYFYLPGSTLGAALLTVIGQCTGAGRPRQGRRYTLLLMAANYAILAVVCTAFSLLRWPLVGLYRLSGDAAYYAQALMLSHAIAMLLWPIAFMTPYYFRAIGRARFTMWVAIIVMWVFRVGGAWLLVRGLGMDVMGVWYAMYLDWIVRVVIYVYAFRAAGKNAA